MQSPSTIFNFLLVALVVALIKAAPSSFPESRIRNIGPRTTGLLEVLRRSENPIPADAPLQTRTRTRRMVYGWGPKGFGTDDGESGSQSDLSLLSADSAETSEHASKVTKQSAPSGPTQAKNGSAVEPPADVIKTLCHYLVSGNSSDKSTGGLSSHGKDVDGKANHSAITPPKENSKIPTNVQVSSSSNKTASDDKHSPIGGKGDKYDMAMSWCYQYMNSSSHHTGAHSGSIGGNKPTTSANGTTLIPPKSSVDDSSATGSKKSPSTASIGPVDTVSAPVRELDTPAHQPTTKKNFKVPSHFQVPPS